MSVVSSQAHQAAAAQLLGQLPGAPGREGVRGGQERRAGGAALSGRGEAGAGGYRGVGARPIETQRDVLVMHPCLGEVRLGCGGTGDWGRDPERRAGNASLSGRAEAFEK